MLSVWFRDERLDWKGGRGRADVPVRHEILDSVNSYPSPLFSFPFRSATIFPFFLSFFLFSI